MGACSSWTLPTMQSRQCSSSDAPPLSRYEVLEKWKVKDVRQVETRERLDYFFEWQAPKGWTVLERTGENVLQIQATTPFAKGSSPPTHGLTISAYGYLKRVKDPDTAKLMDVFIKRFHKGMGNSVRLLGSSNIPIDSFSSRGSTESPSDREQNGEETLRQDPNLLDLSVNSPTVSLEATQSCHDFCYKYGGSLCDFNFKPNTPKAPLARGSCWVLFHPNKRVHYVSMFAAPDAEHAVVPDFGRQLLTGLNPINSRSSGSL